MHPPSRPASLLPIAAVAFAITVWGASFVAARHLLQPSADRASLTPILLATVRFTLASLFFAIPFAVALARRSLTLRDLLRMAFLGQVAFSIYFWLQYTGVRHTNAGVASILAVGLMPSATGVLAPLGGERRPTARAWVALLLGFTGVAVIALGKTGAGLTGTRDFVIGALCLVGNAFAFAAYSLLNRRWMKGIPPVTLTGGVMIFGALGLLAMKAAMEGNDWSALVRLDSIQWGALGFLIVCCSIAGYFAWNFALTRMEASRMAVWIYAEPVVALVLGLLLLGEPYEVTAWLGAAAVAASVILATRKS